jgi:hypothetical protein
MTEVFEHVWVGNLKDCVHGTSERVVIHACKYPCHKRRVGYAKALPSSHEQYLAVEDDWDLFLNMIDPPVPLFKIESFALAKDFLDTHRDREVVIHCNQGESRAPTMAVLCARWRGLHALNTWKDATALLSERYPVFRPGRGLSTFMETHWGALA